MLGIGQAEKAAVQTAAGESVKMSCNNDMILLLIITYLNIFQGQKIYNIDFIKLILIQCLN